MKERTAEDNPEYKLLQKHASLSRNELVARYYINKIIAYIIYYLGLLMPIRERDCKKNDTNWRIIKYEKVLTEEEAEREISPHNITLLEDFKLHLQLLKEKGNVISFKELISRLVNQQYVEPNTVVITFDKGHHSIYKNALPLLKEFGFTATLFVPTVYIGTENMLWEDKLILAIKILKERGIKIDDFAVIKGFQATFDDFKRRFHIEHEWYSALVYYMRTLEQEVRTQSIYEIIDHVEKITPLPKVKSFMSWKELELAHQDGFDIATMGHGYQFFRDLSVDEITEDINTSIKVLQEHKIEPALVISPPDQDELFPEVRPKVVAAGALFFCGGEMYWDDFNSQELGIYFRRVFLYDFATSKPELAMQLWDLRLLNYAVANALEGN